MAISGLFGAAASFLYAVSNLLGGAQHNAALQKTLAQNFESNPNPTHLFPRVGSLQSYNNNTTSPGLYASPSSSASATNNYNVVNTSAYNAQFTPVPTNHKYVPIMSPYGIYGSESATVNNTSINPKDLFPNLPASQRANSGRMLMMSENSDLGKYGVAYYDGETIATVYAARNGNISHCELLEVNHPEEQVAALKQLAQENKIIEKIGFHGMLNLIKACQSLEVENVNPPQDEEGNFEEISYGSIGGASENPILNPLDILVGKKKNMWSMVSGILPGTKWCGLKDIATNYNDLGTMRDLDKCCRSHDLCPRKVLAFRAAYGLVNWSFYAKSHCECDSALYDCLKRVAITNPTAELVGNFYFNVLRVQCVDEENPPKCVQFDGFSCIKWENDNTEANKLVFREVRHRFR